MVSPNNFITKMTKWTNIERKSLTINVVCLAAVVTNATFRLQSPQHQCYDGKFLYRSHLRILHHDVVWWDRMRFFFRRHQEKSKRKEEELTKFNFRFYFGSFYIAGRDRLSSGSIKSKTIDWHVISIHSAVIVSLHFVALRYTALFTYLVLWPTAYHFKTAGYILRVFASSILIFRQQQMKLRIRIKMSWRR